MSWSFDLHEPGMTSFHQAGLLGLVASLKTGLLNDLVEPDIQGNKLTLRGLSTEPKAVHRFFQSLFRIEDGLIRFPLHEELSASYRASIQTVLLSSFLQHTSSRRTEKKSVTVGLGEEETSYSFLPLHDFRHRYEETAKSLTQAKQKNKYIQVAGWALPGAVVKHIAHTAQTSIQDTPDRYFLLMCAPLGCLWYQARAYLMNGDWDPKTQSVIVVPRAIKLVDQAEQLYTFYTKGVAGMRKMPLTAGVADATLQSAIGLGSSAFKVTPSFQVMRFGTVGWSRQQKTRTGTLFVREQSHSVRDLFDLVLSCLPTLPARTSKGTDYEQMMPMREQIAQNFLEERPWYIGLSNYIRGGRSWAFRKDQWREGLQTLAQTKALWDSENKRLFVELMQEAVFNRYGQVNAKAQSSGSDRNRVFSREYERMVLDFQHCRTREMLRETLMRFIARANPRLKAQNSDRHLERDVLLQIGFEHSVDWREVRDLCLLAIATYKGRHSEQVDSSITVDEGTEE